MWLWLLYRLNFMTSQPLFTFVYLYTGLRNGKQSHGLYCLALIMSNLDPFVTDWVANDVMLLFEIEPNTY